MSFIFTAVSENKKTGQIPVTISESKTCPDACPLKKNGCYAKYGNLAIHWRRASEHRQGGDWKTLISKIAALPVGQFFRHNQAGDLPGVNNRINKYKVFQLARAAKNKKGFTYTHKPVLTNKKNKEYIKSVNTKTDFVINLSANSLKNADKLKKLNIGPVVTILKDDTQKTLLTPAGNKVILCPAQYMDTNCNKCRLCQKRNRSVIVGFAAHGVGKKYVSKVVKNR